MSTATGWPDIVLVNSRGLEAAAGQAIAFGLFTEQRQRHVHERDGRQRPSLSKSPAAMPIPYISTSRPLAAVTFVNVPLPLLR